ncbi:MAG: terpene cyclase/mutase family protein [Thermoguttaceae bacterium]|nr:terpene cyclase/mutase family protein [Thermoguttaceae bacterium]
MFVLREWIGLVVVFGLIQSGLAGKQGVSSGAAATEPSAAEQVVPLLDSFNSMEPSRDQPLEADAEVIDPRVKARGARVVEPAVIAALRWIADHQLPDGSWSFDHTLAPSCKGKCRSPGGLKEARNAATAMALLPFLAAGQAPKAGEYRRAVGRGVDYLVRNVKRTEQGGSLMESGGTMYSHGLAAIALTEAYGMTQDRALLEPAQAVVNYISYAQDPVGGGWRYMPRQKGDTSVTGWQLHALKNAHMSYLQVPPVAIRKASSFLDSVQANGGATYGYTTPGEGPATTAIGLLGRMYLGWDRDNPALQRGVERVAAWGVSTKGNMYYNYYATQVAHHWGGDVWRKWNTDMRDWLLESQAKDGHEAGSWFFAGGDAGTDRGGRLYTTSLAALMLLQSHREPLPLKREQPNVEFRELK